MSSSVLFWGDYRVAALQPYIACGMPSSVLFWGDYRVIALQPYIACGMPSSVPSWGDYREAALQPYMALLLSSGDSLQRCFSYVITTSSYSSFWERMTLFSYGAYLLLSRLCLCTLSFEYVSILDTSFSLCSFLIVYSFSYF